MPGTGRVQGRAGRDARPSEGFIGLLKLFTFSRKRTLEKHARGLVLNQTEFVRLIELCHLGLLRLRHGVHYHRPPHPKHLIPTDADRDALATGRSGELLSPAAQKTVRKIMQMFRETQWSAGHVFLGPEPHHWHLFIFGKEDEAPRGNHWRGGPHVHFVNWLWPRLDAQVVWDAYVSDGTRPTSSLHIPFEFR
jgi:hypothetical protein